MICNWLGSLKFAYGHCPLNTFFLALLARILSVLRPAADEGS